MPAELDRCVAHVMEKGYAESNAFAICRAQMGLQTDGSEDGKTVEMTAEEIVRKVETALQFQNGPVLRKKMTVLHPLGKYENGADQKGTMTAKRIAGLVENYRKHPRQIPIFMLVDHPEDNDSQPPVGWVEGLEQDRDGNLVANVKLHGGGAAAVGGDMIRGASVYTVQGKDYDGTPIGEVLKHLLLTNEPFDKDMNIAASRAKGGELVACFSTALNKEAAMADSKDTKDADLKARTAVSTDDPPDTATIAAKDETILKLKAENLTLQESLEDMKTKLANSSIDKDKEELALRVKKLEHEREAQEVRELVDAGLRAGTLKAAWCSGYRDGGYAGTHQWFKASKFQGDIKLLRWAVENNPPLYRMGQGFTSGQPNAPAEGTLTLTQEEKDLAIRAGMDPGKLAELPETANFKDWQALRKQGAKG